jgi:hypothetical protein
MPHGHAKRFQGPCQGVRLDARPRAAHILQCSSRGIDAHPEALGSLVDGTSDQSGRARQSVVRGGLALIATVAALAGAVAWSVVMLRPPQRVMLGTHLLDLDVPAIYQVCVFPPFAAWVASIGLAARRCGARAQVASMALLAMLILLAFVRLGGGIPLSGHALCLSAIVAETPVSPRVGAVLIASLAAAGLAVTAWYKVVVWHDPIWFALSVVAGAAMGVAAGAGSHRLAAADR